VREIAVFSGSAHPELAAAICAHLGVPLAPEQRLPRLTVLSVAPLLAEAIRRIHEGESVSALFADGAAVAAVGTPGTDA
jgi:ribose-phosphate pyrophosphokinase